MWAEERKKKRWGEIGGENKGTRFPPLSLSLSSFLFFPRSLTEPDVAPRSTIWTPETGLTTVPVPESRSRLVLAHNSEAPGPRVHTVFVSSVAFHCFVLAVITSCFKRHLTGLHGVTMYRQYTVTCRVLKVWIKHNFVAIPSHWFPSTKCGQSVKMGTGVGA